MVLLWNFLQTSKVVTISKEWLLLLKYSFCFMFHSFVPKKSSRYIGFLGKNTGSVFYFLLDINNWLLINENLTWIMTLGKTEQKIVNWVQQIYRWLYGYKNS